MKRKHFFTFAVLLPLLISCGTFSNILTRGPEISIRKGFDGNGVAVLNFTKVGPLPNDIGKLAADKLTDSFFLNSKFVVVDRSRVNEAQASLEIMNTEFLSSEQIQKVGEKLKANFLILGRVHCITEEDVFRQNIDKQLNISFRIVSVINNDVVGVVNYTCKYDEKLVEKLQEMITAITSKINDLE